jgi:hypothetical protein
MEKIRVDVETAVVELAQLRERHGEIQRRLSELERHLSLTPDEQLERARLKKEKLRTKDRIVLLAAMSTPSNGASPANSTGAPPGNGTRLPAA